MRALAIAALIPLTACMPKPPVGPMGALCVTTDTQAFVGRAFSDAVAADVRMATKAATLRAVRPGQMVTMEFDAQRVTVTLDAADTIVRVACG
ncbi:hypothetical protein ASE86_08850 [Sphingomonas sp. Leaf33]|uniref:I78 family peptidase inhibitor n=1 Tax=Sphingomonas sp. Leaf33 TaxID=1736215 RepID=UPI0006FF9627|nr:I78 family peptidase inhibitor [Sphingomonas sp. Leaf33]KQN26238.1 hypothetical protein ASE86_08850 [Sphingomonas sp. Leaf33]